ncbi:MAG: DUF1330 domain-containing protein [Sphingomonadales bacterium CG12_big_fil_rev_8_21_14_0_65_65_10]|jgi:uncharacterized protein (DUF1330 family)|uniref:DUF1330 domain-containing protein n=1 Tax=Blastomonas marina TaxID=1867408 RepID=A0ABQ1F9T4_9SPHN|nr:DUF1330 domain-containing protein [Blastomonas marina]PIW55951.1 MAG: DUF1330 domain-containing protein [Sphingomonadales bacterium CG12_big_fil_rev_8_21_14_0_65_65_10]GGA03099.1 hypothetical protein GCM10010923_09930 [Blastomonas marina]
MSHVNPSEANFRAFKDLPRDTPIQMLNLVRFRSKAEYPEGHELHGKGWTGDEAYAEYGRASGPIFARVGGKIVWRGRYETVVTGPDDEHWDAAFIAEYPDAGAFFEMIKDPDYQEAVVNRTAAVEDSRLIRFGKIEGGEGFA